jgi:hypothetical protein
MRFSKLTTNAAVAVLAALFGGAVAILSDLTIIGIWLIEMRHWRYPEAMVVHLPDVLIVILLGIFVGRCVGKSWLVAGLSGGLGFVLMPALLGCAIGKTAWLAPVGLAAFITAQCWKILYVLLFLQFTYLSSRSLSGRRGISRLPESLAMPHSIPFVRGLGILALSLAAWFVVFILVKGARIDFIPGNRLLWLPPSLASGIGMAALLVRVWPSYTRRPPNLQAVALSRVPEGRLPESAVADSGASERRCHRFGLWILLVVLVASSGARVIWDEATICGAANDFRSFDLKRDKFDIARPIIAAEQPGKMYRNDASRQLARLHEVLPNCTIEPWALTTSRTPLVMAFFAVVCSVGLVLVLMSALSLADRGVSRLPFVARLLFIPVAYYFLAYGFYLFGGPEYHREAWLIASAAITESATWGKWFAYAISILVTTDVLIQSRLGFRRVTDVDTAYYPRLANVRASLTRPWPRLILIVGFLALFMYYAITVARLSPRFGGSSLPWSPSLLVSCYYFSWPPEQMFVCCALAWGILWLADCACRPRHGTICAAIGFLLAAYCLIEPAIRGSQ